MIQPITKLVTISTPSETQRSHFDLNTVDGRFQLGERLQVDIDEWCRKAFDDGPRSHLGASVIGGECDRHTWYSYRWFKHTVFSGRMQRLFQDGHWYEERFIEMLRGIGCVVSQVNEAGEQHRIYACEGHFGGSTDGGMFLPSAYGFGNYPFLAEFKTINDKNFNKVHDVKSDKTQHWGQMCVYGVKLQITHAIYFLVNKNDADLYIEVVPLDWAYGQYLIDKGQWIIYSQVPPPRLSENPSDWRCKMCDHHGVCHMRQTPDVNCRTCQHSQAIDNNEWRCNHWQAIIPNKEAMLAGCANHTPLKV